jgi:hypothetical protein
MDLRRTTYEGRDARCSASHCSLIQPSLAGFTPPGTRPLTAITVTANPTKTVTRSNMVVNAPGGSAMADVQRSPEVVDRHGFCGCRGATSRAIIPDSPVRVCAVVNSPGVAGLFGQRGQKEA